MKRISATVPQDDSHLIPLLPQLAAVEREAAAPKDPDIPETVTGWLRSLGYLDDPEDPNPPELTVIRGGRG